MEEIEIYEYWDKSKDIYRKTYIFPSWQKQIEEYKLSDYFATYEPPPTKIPHR